MRLYKLNHSMRQMHLTVLRLRKVNTAKEKRPLLTHARGQMTEIRAGAPSR
jgi:hypothetical protein